MRENKLQRKKKEGRNYCRLGGYIILEKVTLKWDSKAEWKEAAYQKSSLGRQKGVSQGYKGRELGGRRTEGRLPHLAQLVAGEWVADRRLRRGQGQVWLLDQEVNLVVLKH